MLFCNYPVGQKSAGLYRRPSMPFDYKKGFKEFYLPPTKPQIVHIPKMQFVAVLRRRRLYSDYAHRLLRRRTGNNQADGFLRP